MWGTLGISTTVLFEAILSYLGVGVRPPEPSWGNIVSDGQSYFQTAPWLVFIPGFAVAILVALSVNLVGDALRDLLDPTLARTALMPAYLARRLFQAALILLGVAAITYLLLYMLPADPARMVAGRTASKEQVDLVRQQLGLNLPIWEQFGNYLWKLVQGDLGRSYLQRTQVTELLAGRLPASLLLMVGAIFCELLIGLTLGTIAGLRRGNPRSIRASWSRPWFSSPRRNTSFR